MPCGIPVVHALSVDSGSAMLDRLPCDRLALAGPYVRRANGVFPGIPLVQALSVDSVSATLAAARAIPILQTAATLRGSAAPHCLRLFPEDPLPESTPSETVRRVAMPASTPAMDPSELQSGRRAVIRVDDFDQHAQVVSFRVFNWEDPFGPMVRLNVVISEEAFDGVNEGGLYWGNIPQQDFLNQHTTFRLSLGVSSDPQERFLDVTCIMTDMCDISRWDYPEWELHVCAQFRLPSGRQTLPIGSLLFRRIVGWARIVILEAGLRWRARTSEVRGRSRSRSRGGLTRQGRGVP